MRQYIIGFVVMFAAGASVLAAHAHHAAIKAALCR